MQGKRGKLLKMDVGKYTFWMDFLQGFIIG